ncbi:response regulator transcription factor [Psychroserpens burtonensis]|uniref:Response regulator transcription factor n=1 Tax=Psychroserpens burtonensis TaxID=49278 RepID=A0A5C7BCV0_9FLAO|nr:response regulator transcription factor [Psychroserpens burtonensis]TXE16857.1 response regulator transcription factor [Psychroserpens burtonensis]
MEKTSYNVLLIDDHPSIIEAFQNVLKHIEKQNENLTFNIESANDCQSAFFKINTKILNQNLDLVMLDISSPAAAELKINSGEDLGILLRQQLPKTKILVCTFYDDAYRLSQIQKLINPEGFICKNDLGFMGFVKAFESFLSNNNMYSQSVINALRQKSQLRIVLDDYDILILKELANGSKMKDLLELVPLSKSAIDKRIRTLKRKFNIESNSNRDLVLAVF